MKIHFRWVLILMLQTATANEVAVSPSHADLLNRHRAEYVQAVLAGKAEPIVRNYSEQVRLMPAYHGTVFGRNNARAYHVAFLERFDVQAYTRDAVKSFDLGSRVVEIGRFKMSLATSRGERTPNLDGKYMDIWEKVNGSLVLTTQGWNFDRYPDIANDLRFHTVPSERTAFHARVPVKDDLSFELAALNKLHEIAVTQHDDKVWSLYFAPEAVLLTNHDRLIEGKAQIDAYLAEHVKQFPIFEQLDIRNDRIDASGRYVIEYASHVANWRNGDSSGVNTGKNIRIWRREPSGSLKMICQIGMYD